MEHSDIRRVILNRAQSFEEYEQMAGLGHVFMVSFRRALRMAFRGTIDATG